MEQTTLNAAAGTEESNGNNIAKNLTQLMYCVATGHNIGVWNGTEWVDCKCPWTVIDMVFDNQNRCWIVGTGGNVGILNLETGEIVINYGLIGGWLIKSIDFDANGTLWCVGANGNVGEWNGYSWNDHGLLGGWTLQSICVRNPIQASLCWGVNTSNELGVYMLSDPGKWANDFNPNNVYQSVASTPPSSSVVYVGIVGSGASNTKIMFYNTGSKLGGITTNWTLLTVAFLPVPKV